MNQMTHIEAEDVFLTSNAGVKYRSLQGSRLYALGLTYAGPWLHFSGQGYTADKKWCWRGTLYQRENMRKLVPDELVWVLIKREGSKECVTGWR